MKILHIVDSGGVYGKEQVVLNLIKEQKEQEHLVHLFVMGATALMEEAINRDIEVFRICNGKMLTASVLTSQSLYDVIHVHDYKSGILLGIQKALGRLKTPLIRTIHGYTSTGKPWYAKIRLYEALDKFCLRFSDKVVGVSDNMKGFKGIDIIVPNGIEPFTPDHLTIDEKFWTQHPDNFIIMCSARLSAEKNLDELIRAIRFLQLRREDLHPHGSFPEMGIKLYIFGDGPLRGDLEVLIEDLNLTPSEGKLDEVYLMGFKKNARDFLRIVDVYIQPSYTEGMPISVLEAMSARRLTITSYVGGMTSLYDAGAVLRCGTDSMSIASTIAHASHMNHDEITEKAYELFHSKYSSQAMAQGYLDVYKQAIKG